MGILVEICCTSPADAVAAQEGGGARIELCSALAVGGLTPSAGIIAQTKKNVSLPIMALIRPRAGGFHYSPSEFEVMEADTEHALQNGAEGIVFGVLENDGSVDVPRSRRLLAHIGTRTSVFHRAFDLTPDPFRALEQLIDLGVQRILTSGQENAAPEGVTLIRQLIERADGRIEIMSGGGITADNVLHVIAATGCTQIHTSASTTFTDTSAGARPRVSLNKLPARSEGEYRATDINIVRSITELVKQATV